MQILRRRFPAISDPQLDEKIAAVQSDAQAVTRLLCGSPCISTSDAALRELAAT